MAKVQYMLTDNDKILCQGVMLPTARECAKDYETRYGDNISLQLYVSAYGREWRRTDISLLDD